MSAVPKIGFRENMFTPLRDRRVEDWVRLAQIGS